jgi:hypothetical protein
MTSTPIVSIPVGVAVERRKAHSPWVEAVWRPASVFVGAAAASAWTIIDSGKDATTFYAGPAAINLYRTETANYRSNLASGSPLLWVILRPIAGEPPFELLAVTADPAEGEALTGAGNDLVETVPMAPAIGRAIQAFIAAHHVEQPMFKRQRDRTGLSSGVRLDDGPKKPQ